MNFREIPLAELLQDRRIFSIFDDEFRKGTWLDVTALLGSESTLGGLYEDGTVPTEVLDNILKRLRALH